MAKDFLIPNPKAREKLISDLKSRNNDRTILDYLDSYKRFSKWKYDQIDKDIVKYFDFKPNNNHKMPEDLITPEEARSMIDHAGNPRDKSMISILYDSGCRISEILTLRKNTIEFDNMGITLSVIGKTGYRKVYVLGSSVPLLKQWLSVHSSRDPNDYVFCELSNAKKSLKKAA